MKIKRAKILKKTLNFYKINLDFFDPFHIILDGNFLHLLREKKVDIKEKLEKIIKGTVLLHVSECIVKELSALGEDFRGSYIQARKLMRIKCHINETKDPKTCILDIIGEKNEGKYMVGTQDEDLRRELRRIPGVPIFYFSKESLQIEEPSIETKGFLEGEKQRKYEVKSYEYKRVFNEKVKEELEIRKNKKLGIIKEIKKMGVLIKRKAKGPNPLSIRKKPIEKMKEKKIIEGKNGLGLIKGKKRSRNRGRNKKNIT